MKNNFGLRMAVILTGVLAGFIWSAGVTGAFPYFYDYLPGSPRHWHSCISVSVTPDVPEAGTTIPPGVDDDGGIFGFNRLMEHGLRPGFAPPPPPNEGTELFGYSTDAYRTCMDIHPTPGSLIEADDAGTPDDFRLFRYVVRGWGWNENLGWVSFNCEDWAGAGEVCGLTNDYTTEIDYWGYLSGHAWSTTMGWIEFDWDYDPSGSCGGADPCDAYYFNEVGESIPLGRAFDNWMARPADEYLGEIPDDAVKGKFWGWAWNDAVGWMSLHDAYGKENTTGNPHDDEYWHPVAALATLDFTPDASTWTDPTSMVDDVVTWADGEDYYDLRVRIQKYPYGLTDYFPELAACGGTDSGVMTLQWVDGVDAIEADKNLFYDQISELGEVDKVDIEKHPPLPLDFDGGDNSYSLAHFESPVPTSNINGRLDGATFEPYDADPDLYHYYFGSIDFNADICLSGVLMNVEFYNVGEVGMGDLDAEDDRYLKFKPAIFMTEMTQAGERFVTAYRGVPSPINAIYQRSSNVDDADFNTPYIDFELYLKNMFFNPNPLVLAYTDTIDTSFHFVFDQICNDGGGGCPAGDREIIPGGEYEYADLPVGYLRVDNTFFGAGVTEIANFVLEPVPVLAEGETEDAILVEPGIEAHEIQYMYGGAGGTLVRYNSDRLAQELGESVYNPVADITGTISATSGIVEVRTEQAVVSVGDVTTNVLRNWIFQNVAALRRGVGVAGDVAQADGEVVVEEDAGMGWSASQGVIDRGALVFHDQVYYFKNSGGDAPAIVISDGVDGAGDIDWGAGEKTLIVEGGNVFIDENLVSVDQFGIIALRDAAGEGGNVYIHPDVVSIKAIIFADGVLTTYDGDIDNISVNLNGKDYPVPDPDLMTCPDNVTPATVEEVLHNQLQIIGAVTSKNSIGGSDKPLPIIGTGERLTAAAKDRVVAKFYDFNSLRYYRLDFVRNATDGIQDRQCYDLCALPGAPPECAADAWCCSGLTADTACYTDNQTSYELCAGILGAPECGELRYYHLDHADGDVQFRPPGEVICDDDPADLVGDKSAFGEEDVDFWERDGTLDLAEEKLAPLYIEYEAPSSTLPGFWAPEDVPGSLQVNR